MSDFSAALRRRAGMAQPAAGPSPDAPPMAGPPSGPPPAGGGLVMAIRQATMALAQAAQSGNIPPEAMVEIQKFAQIIAQLIQQAPQGGPPGAPPGGEA